MEEKPVVVENVKTEIKTEFKEIVSTQEIEDSKVVINHETNHETLESSEEKGFDVKAESYNQQPKSLSFKDRLKNSRNSQADTTSSKTQEESKTDDLKDFQSQQQKIIEEQSLKQQNVNVEVDKFLAKSNVEN